MSLASLYKVNQSRVLGIDASTHTIAYCLFDGKTPVEWGEINFDGGNIYCLLYTSPSPRDRQKSRMPSSA